MMIIMMMMMMMMIMMMIMILNMTMIMMMMMLMLMLMDTQGLGLTWRRWCMGGMVSLTVCVCIITIHDKSHTIQAFKNVILNLVPRLSHYTYPPPLPYLSAVGKGQGGGTEGKRRGKRRKRRRYQLCRGLGPSPKR